MAGFQVHSTSDVLLVNLSEKYLHYVRLDQSKVGKVALEVKGNLADFDFKKISKNVLVHFIGTGIINRKVPVDDAERIQVLPQGQEEEFYIQHKLSSGFDFVSFIRRDHVDEVLKLLSFGSNNVTIGPFIIDYTCEIDFELVYAENELIDFKRNKNHQLMDSDIITYAKCVVSNLKSEHVLSIFSGKELKRILGEVKEKKKFIQLSVGILSFIFCVLVVNYFIQRSYLEENANLESDIQVYGNNLALIDQLSLEIERKQNLIQSSGIYKKDALSKYVDELVLTVPTTIQLKILSVFPFLNEPKQKKKVEVDKSKVFLTGEVASSFVFESWIRSVEEIAWVKEVVIKNYQKGSSNSIFEIDIIL